MAEYKTVALDLAKRAGEIMRKNFTLWMKKDWKADRSPVTDADITINALVIEEIRKRWPDHSIIGEEQSDAIEGAEYAWVCDPVDGTIPFSNGVPLGTFVLALCRDGVPTLGVIYDPFMDRMFVACGNFIASVATLNTCHDGAALKVIVEEAGGKMTDVLGNEQRYDRPINGFVASNGLVHDELLAMIRASISENSV